MLDRVNVAVVVSTLDGRIVDCNRHAEQLWGVPREEIIGQFGTVFSVEPIEPALASEIARRLESGQTWEGDFRLRRRDGSVVMVHAVDSGVFDDDGNLRGVVSISSDVSERWRALRWLTAQEQLARELATATDLGTAGQRVLEIVRNGLSWSFGALWEVVGDTLRCVGVSTIDGDARALEAHTREVVPGRDDLAVRAWENRAPTAIVELADVSPSARLGTARAAGLSKAVCVPLLDGDEVVGVLELFGSSVDPVDHDLPASLSALGVQLGAFVARRRAQEAARVTEARKAAMLEASLDAVVSIDHEGRIVEWNDAARCMFGWSREEVLGRPVQEVIVPPALQIRHVEGFAGHLRDGHRTFLDRRVETIAMRRDGTEIPIELAVRRVEGLGAPFFTAFLRDISERVKAEAERVALERREHAARTRLDLMARLGDILTVDLDATQRLQAIAAVLLPVFSDICAVVTPDGSGGVRFAALAHSGEVTQPLMDAIAQWSVLQPIDGSSAELIIGDGPQIVEPITDEMLELAFPEPSDRAMVRDLGVNAVLVVPLPGDDGPMGALAFASRDPQRHYGADDIALAEEIARRFAPVVEGALRLEEERTMAEMLQRSLLPQRLPDIPELDVAARYLPGTAGLAVGGDWYDLLPLPDGRVLLAIGDVVGHGVMAAAAMGRARAAAQLCALTEVGPGELLTRLNTFFAADGEASMLTLFVALHEPFTGRLEYANAGHPPPLVRDAAGGVRFLDGTTGAPLGADPMHAYGQHVDELGPGASLVLYTDGLVERRNESLDVGLSRLRHAVQAGPEDLADLLAHLLTVMLPEAGAGDDVALLVVRSKVEGERLQLALPARPDQLRILRTRLAGWLERHGVDREAIFEFSLAVSEAAANAVSHAYGLEAAGFGVEVVWDDNVLVCTVSDRGRWQAQPRDDDGRGLMLMRTLSDSLDIDAGENGTRVVLRRRVRYDG